VYASEAFTGKSPHGIYSDAIEELDWSVGRILAVLEELGIDDNTLVIFTSDNGATRDGENHPLRGGKATIWEGGMRVPCVMRWPSRMPAGRVVSEVITCMDLLPTFAGLAGGTLPEKTIDGHDIAPLLTGEADAASPYEKFFYYRIDQLRAVRSGKWKLHLAVDPTIEGWDGKGRGKAELALYDLESDIGEERNVAAQHPEVVERLKKYAEEARKEIGDWKLKGSGQRPAGMVERSVHSSDGVELEPTDWIGNPDSPLFQRAGK
jgi:arylsulfatase A-like enzyme